MIVRTYFVMSKFVLILVAAVVSMAMAFSVVDDLPEIDWRIYAKEAARRINSNKVLPKVQPINWYNYGSGGYVNVPENDGINKNNNNIVRKSEGQQIDCNQYGKGKHQKTTSGNNHATGNNVDEAHETIKYTNCKPSDDYKDSPGMKDWCLANCFHNPPFCPASHCCCW